MSTGWKCPWCGRCFAPHVSMCTHCTTPVFSTTTTNGGYTCLSCGMWVFGSSHSCSKTLPGTLAIPTMWTGWTCARCGQFVVDGTAHLFCPTWQIANQPWYEYIANGHAPNWDL